MARVPSRARGAKPLLARPFGRRRSLRRRPSTASLRGRQPVRRRKRGNLHDVSASDGRLRCDSARRMAVPSRFRRMSNGLWSSRTAPERPPGSSPDRRRRCRYPCQEAECSTGGEPSSRMARRILFNVHDEKGDMRTFVQDVAGGSPRPIGDKGIWATVVSPDGRLVAGGQGATDHIIYAADGSGPPRPVAGAHPRRLLRSLEPLMAGRSFSTGWTSSLSPCTASISRRVAESAGKRWRLRT